MVTKIMTMMRMTIGNSRTLTSTTPIPILTYLTPQIGNRTLLITSKTHRSSFWELIDQF